MADHNDLSDLGGIPDDLSDLGGTLSPTDAATAKGAPVPSSDKPMSAREMAEMAAANPDNSSMKQAALSGAAQGATFGFSDELGAGADVAKDALTGNPQAKKWREYQKLRESANMADQAAHPGAYFAGELAGGIATTPLMPELGGAKAISMLGKLSPKVAAFLAKSTPEAMAIKQAIQSGKLAPEAAELALKMAPEAGSMAKIAGAGTKMAIEGAPAGGLYGLGASENDMSNPEELAKDTASGMAMGSLGGLAIGGGIQVGKEALGAAGKAASKYDFTRKLGHAFDMGGEGVSFDTSEGKTNVAKMSKQIPHDITNQIMAADKQLGMAVGNSLVDAEHAGVRINIDPELKASADETFKMFADNPVLLATMDPKSKAIITKVSQEGLGDLSPIEARALKDTFYDLTDKLGGLSSDVATIARQRGNSLAQALDNQLKVQVPEYKKAAAQFANFRSSIPETLLQPGLPAELRTKQLGGLKDKTTELYKGASNVFGNAHMPGSSTIEGPRAAMGELSDNLQKLQKSNPEAVKALGGSAEDVAQKWHDQADKMAVLRQSQGVEPHEGLKKTIIGQVVGSGEGFAYNMANRAGKINKSIGQSAPVKTSQRVFAASNDALMGLAAHLKSTKGAEPLGEALEKALANKDDMGKNAVLFKLLQVPEYRNMLRDPNDKSDQ